MSRSSWLSPSTMRFPLFLFHCFATSSNTFSANPSSRHPDPQLFPMNVASACKAVDVSVRPYFFVKVRKDSGRKLAGGIRTGSTEGFAWTSDPALWIGYAGLPKAGDEEGTSSRSAALRGNKVAIESWTMLNQCVFTYYMNFCEPQDVFFWKKQNPFSQEFTSSVSNSASTRKVHVVWLGVRGTTACHKSHVFEPAQRHGTKLNEAQEGLPSDANSVLF